jgi:pimeloyl-ACP methyl ester carboxylesterase
VRLELREWGGGGRPLLAVHGFTGAKEDFAGPGGALAGRGWHVASPDLRGHGASPAPPTGYGLVEMAGDLVALADALDWPGFVLLGHSMGGMVAQRLALDHPQRVRALVLVGTTHGAVDVDRGLVELACEVVRGGGMPALVAAQRALLADAAETPSGRRLRARFPDWEDYRDRSILACSPDMYVEAVKAMLDATSRLDALAALDVPTLVVVGEEDEVMLDGSRRLAAAIPGAELVVLAGAAHSPQVEAPEAFLDAVVGFLDRLPPA